MIITQKKSLRIWSTLKFLWIRRCSRNDILHGHVFMMNSLLNNQGDTTVMVLCCISLTQCCDEPFILIYNFTFDHAVQTIT